MARFNLKAIRDKLEPVFDEERVGGRAIRNATTEVLRQRQQLMIGAFDSHPVTREIENGPFAENTSGTLTGTRGNLFSFIGFPIGSNPTDKLRTILLRKDIIRLGRREKTSPFTFAYPILVPTNQDLENHFSEQLAMPWDTGIWPVRISTGISGLSYYLSGEFDEGKSRSTGGIQVRNKIRTASYKRVSYLIDIFRALGRR